MSQTTVFVIACLMQAFSLFPAILWVMLQVDRTIHPTAKHFGMGRGHWITVWAVCVCAGLALFRWTTAEFSMR